MRKERLKILTKFGKIFPSVKIIFFSLTKRDISSIFYEKVVNSIVNISVRQIPDSLPIDENRNWPKLDQFISLLDISTIHRAISYISISNDRG